MQEGRTKACLMFFGMFLALFWLVLVGWFWLVFGWFRRRPPSFCSVDQAWSSFGSTLTEKAHSEPRRFWMGVLLSMEGSKNPGFLLEVVWRLVLHFVRHGIVFGWYECNNTLHQGSHNYPLRSPYIEQPYVLPSCASSVHELS